MAAYVTLILLAVCAMESGDRAQVDWARLYARAQSQLDRTEFESARQAADAGYRFWRGWPASKWHWLFRLTLADALLDLDRINEAQPLLDRAAPAPEWEARRQAGLAFLNVRLNRYAAAARYLDTAESLASHQQRDLTGRIAMMRGAIRLQQNRPAEAEASFHSALDALAGSGSPAESYALTDLGYLDLQHHRYDEAVFWFERARKIAVDTGSKRALALTSGNLGDCYLELGDLDRSLQLFGEASRLSESLGDRAYDFRWTRMLGEVSHEMGSDAAAYSYYQKARGLAAPGRDDDWLISILSDLAELDLQKGDVADAEQLIRESSGLHAQRALIDPQVRAAEILKARAQDTEAEAAYKRALEAARSIDEPAGIWECHAGLASLYSKSGRAAEAEREYRAAIETIETERSKLRQDQSKFSFLSHLIRFYQDYVDFRFSRNDIAGAFGVAESSRGLVLTEKLNGVRVEMAPDIERLRSLASGSHTVFLSFWLARGRSLLWVIDAGGLHAFALPGEEAITAQVRRYTDAVLRGADPLATESAAGRWLFTQLIGSHYSIPAGSKVLIVPDGSLHDLNFESLPGEDGKRYWVEDVTISVAPSLALVAHAAEVSHPRLLLIGDPDAAGAEFPRLPNAKSEIAAVSRRFASQDLFTAARATPDAYRTAPLASYSTVHFAAHAVANREDPLDSAIILSGPAGSQKLYARDVMTHPLRADLVTLSACQTAGNRTYYGEGLTGFSWAFLSAGARNVIAGLWAADDRATAQLMDRLYEALAKGEPPAEALRTAKLGLMAAGGPYRKPVYWAAFETFTLLRGR